MSDDSAIEVIEPVVERIVDFYGDSIPAAQVAEGEIFVPLRPLTNFLGLDYSAQNRRVQRDPVMADQCRMVRVKVQASGQRQEVFCLPLELLPGWLFGITTARVSPELHEKLNRYRRECFKVLWNAFKGDVLPAAGQRALSSFTPAEQILAQAEAVAALARQQVEFERGLSEVVGKQQVMAEYMRGFIQQTNQRLTALELRLDPAAQITDAEAAEIALAVKNVAHAMEERGTGGSYGKVYSEMYRRYRISGYKNLPRAKYVEVIQWLSRWYDEVVGKDDEGEEHHG